MQRLLTRLVSRLYERAEAHAEQVQDVASLAALLSAAGGPPPALLAALQAVLADDSLDGEYRVRG